ncbi:rod binding protein [Rhodovulum bhavnagarense]|uniref:Rod binding protein n=1 Tax=Rhodovulum bhavnagarense TaxID=992286 RepID=A0A4R2RN56_9RHOB|nr:rod-binding protein [Rhodovulum bhavnagarense]TCP61201.1 rod binding protein [Rhodovulum bhavnagarense]
MLSPLTDGSVRQSAPPATLHAAALRIEALFLAEMLKSAGLDARSGPFGGGAGETQFSSFLRREQAEMMARAGGIGLAESLFEALKERSDDTG